MGIVGYVLQFLSFVLNIFNFVWLSNLNVVSLDILHDCIVVCISFSIPLVAEAMRSLVLYAGVAALLAGRPMKPPVMLCVLGLLAHFELAQVC